MCEEQARNTLATATAERAGTNAHNESPNEHSHRLTNNATCSVSGDDACSRAKINAAAAERRDREAHGAQAADKRKKTKTITATRVPRRFLTYNVRAIHLGAQTWSTFVENDDRGESNRGDICIVRANEATR